MCYQVLGKLAILMLLVTLSGCSSLLPRSKSVTESPWQEYGEAQTSFEKIEVGKTTAEELQKLGFDVKSSRNVKILTYLEIAAMLQGIPVNEQDPGLRACLKARSDCHAYVFEPKRSRSKRVGNFWLDIFNFRRETRETGWHFKALIVFVNHHVAYKLASGEPQIDQMTDRINPLGPFQAPADIFTRALF